MELIDKAAFMKYPIRINHYDKEHGNEHFVLGIESVLEFAEQLPIIDAVEVRRGFWIDTGEYVTTAYGHLDIYKCSECGANITIDDHDSFCPACGCRMDGRRESEGT